MVISAIRQLDNKNDHKDEESGLRLAAEHIVNSLKAFYSEHFSLLYLYNLAKRAYDFWNISFSSHCFDRTLANVQLAAMAKPF